MNWGIVNLVINSKVRNLCFEAYPNHKNGCPNYGKKKGCPPQAPMINEILDITSPVWAVWNIFDFKTHCNKMRRIHPKWSIRQVECCLYWQGTARKQLRMLLQEFESAHKQYNFTIVTCPEACGVDITKTMLSVGQMLEWPPIMKTYQVILAGIHSMTEDIIKK